LNFSLHTSNALSSIENVNQPLGRFLAQLEGVHPSGNGFMARCPAHEDRSPSLSVHLGDDGRVLFKCHAGCETVSILNKLKLSWADLFVADFSKEKRAYRTTQEIQGWPWTEALYEYLSAAGHPVFLVVRLRQPGKKKTFVQYRSSGTDRWIKGLDGIPTVLYQLPEVTRARASGVRILITEGEKDVESLRRLGFVATCNPGGAGKWLPRYSEALQNADVVILPDNDDVGEAHAYNVAKSLSPTTKSVRILALPGLPPKGDVSDWLSQKEGNRTLELNQLLDQAPRWTPAEVLSLPAKVRETEQLHLTDMGNAQRLVRDHGGDLRFCHPWQQWLIWDGRRWIQDQTGEVYRRVKMTIRGIYGEAVNVLDDRQRFSTVEHAKRSEAQSRLKAAINSAESEPGIPVLPEQLDADLWTLNCLNGTLDLRTGALHPHRREDLITKIIPVAYDPEADCPNWEKFVAKILNEDPRLTEFLQRAIGYALTGETREHCLFFLYGTGRNGKSTLLECLYGLLGDYAQKAEFSTFLEKKQDSVRNDLARLKGCRMLSASEASEDRRFAESLIKDITGGESITARHLYGEFFDFKPAFKLFLSANHKPSSRGTDEGIWSRIRLIPFTVYIPAQDRDAHLAEKLRMEWPGILAWAVRGCLEWQRIGLKQPEEVAEATQQYRDEMDPLAGFLASCCKLDANLHTSAKLLYEAYARWTRNNEEEPIIQKSFGIRLGEKGLRRYRGRFEGQVVWLWGGLSLA
jgi:putative DNA primase/helicase